MTYPMPTLPPLSRSTGTTTERIAAYRNRSLCSLVTIWPSLFVKGTVVATWQTSDGSVVGSSVFGNLEYLKENLVSLGYEVVDA